MPYSEAARVKAGLQERCLEGHKDIFCLIARPVTNLISRFLIFDPECSFKLPLKLLLDAVCKKESAVLWINDNRVGAHFKVFRQKR